MGKPTGFMDYERETSVSEAPLERIRNFNEFHTPLSKGRTADTGRALHELRRSLLSGGNEHHGNDERMPVT